MGGKDPSRQPRLCSLRETPAGWIRVASCNSCRHQGVLPIDRLIRKHGELCQIPLRDNPRGGPAEEKLAAE